MDPNRWLQIEEVFHQAINLSAPAQLEFVAEVCDSSEIQAEVISLLEQVKEAMVFDRLRMTGIGSDLETIAERIANEVSNRADRTSNGGEDAGPGLPNAGPHRERQGSDPL